MPKRELEENVHYYLEKGMLVFTERYHIERGSCCGKGCRHCPYEPTHEKGSKQLKHDGREINGIN